jgi:HTH-type transcriptional regulator/antitoxin HigA
MNITPIKSEADYRKALKRLEVLFDAPVGTPESDEADLLGLMVDEYEKKHYPFETIDQ